MRRREFIAGLGGAVGWPLTARTHQAVVPAVGLLNQSTFDEKWRARREVFRNCLAETGFVGGGTLAIEYRWAEDRNDRLPALADDLVLRQVAVIVATADMSATTAAMAATQTVPIVFFVGTNLVGYGLVASLARPAGNATAFTQFVGELMAKRMELLHQLVPAVTSIGFLFNPTNPATATEEVRKAGCVLGLEVLMIGAARQSDIDRAFAAVQQPSKLEPVINLKTAKALGLTVPPSLLVAADEVIG